MSEPLVLGLGEPWRGDDGVGPWIAERLAARGRAARGWRGDGLGLVALFEGRRAVVLLDATRGAGPPGTLTRLDGAGPLPRGLFRGSTHEFGLAEAVETARALGLLPPALRLYGIEGASFALGEGLSPEVARSAARLLEELSAAP